MLDEVVFDMEVFPNWWCMVYTNPVNMNEKLVLTNETPNYLSILKVLIIKRCLIGFNIKNYDLRILNAILGSCDPQRVYKLSEAIINDDKSDVYNSYSFWQKFNFTDLYDDWRYGSLKEYESNSGMSIKESDVPFGKENLTQAEKDEIIEYCKHDVDATISLLNTRREYVDSKKMLSELFDIPLAKALKSTNAKLCALVLEAEPRQRRLDNKFKIPENVETYIRANLPESVISLFEYLNDDQKVVNLFDNEITFGIGGIHSTYADNIIAKSDDKYLLMNIDVTLTIWRN